MPGKTRKKRESGKARKKAREGKETEKRKTGQAKAGKGSEEKGFSGKATFFLLKFFVIYGVLQALVLAAPIMPLNEAIASLEAGLLGLESDSSIILLEDMALEINASCTGFVGISVLASIIFSLKRPKIKKKAGMLATGAVVLFPLNLLRVYLVVASAKFLSVGEVEAVHVSTWFGTSAAILLLWYYLTKRSAKARNFEELM